jgi:hypothetical protein
MKHSKLSYKKYPFLKIITIPFLLTIVLLAFIVGTKYQQILKLNNNIISVPSRNRSTSNWKTYTSDTYKFSFQYPEEWVLKEATNPSFWVCASCESYGGPTEPGVICNPAYNLGAVCVSISNAKDFSEIVSNKMYTENEKISFLGDEAIRVVQPGGPSAGGSYLTSFIKHDIRIGKTSLTRIYEIGLVYKDLFNIEKLSEFPGPKPDILSTFKFLD